MKNLFKNTMLFAFLATTAIFTSCSDENNDLINGPDTEVNYNLIVTPTNINKISERNLTIVAKPNGLQKVNVKFTSLENMYRLYITKNDFSTNQGEVPFVYTEAIDTKKDGSIDLGSDDKKEFTFNINFNTPIATNETVQYKLWVTTGRGDFRNVAKRNAIKADAFGTITIKGDENANDNSSNIKAFSQVLLAAPLADGSSKTFISLFDNKTYAINQGEEVAALWDFGYYYGNTNKASFASTSNYPSDIIDIEKISGTTDLNNFYFKKSTKTVADFNDVNKSEDLDFIAKPTDERIKNLAENDIIEFVDTYGNKGLIKITKITAGNGSDGAIEFDVKVQVETIPIKG